MAVGIISAIPEEYTRLEWDSEPKKEIIIRVITFGTFIICVFKLNYNI